MRMKARPASHFTAGTPGSQREVTSYCAAPGLLSPFHPLWLCPSSSPKLAGLEAVPWPKTQGPGVSLFVRLVTTHKLMAAIFSAGVSRTYLAKWQPLGWEGCQTTDLGTGLGEE